MIPQFFCPRIRVTKTDGGRAIIPIDAISGIDEDKHNKCVKISTMDGFWYEVKNQILEVDKKIDEAIIEVNGRVPIILPSPLTPSPVLPSTGKPAGKLEVYDPVETGSSGQCSSTSDSEPQNIPTPYENRKCKLFKRKKMLSAGIDKPARRVQNLNKGQPKTTPPVPSNNTAHDNNAPEKGTGEDFFHEWQP